MAPGVAKTYKKRYRSNLASLIEVMDSEEHAKAIKKAFVKLEDMGLVPTLDKNETYDAEEAKLAEEIGIPVEIYQKAHAFTVKKSTEETDKETYQAMEALLHNLNTMHSRAGAQTPFSSINYGMDTSTEARMVMKNMLLVTEAGLGDGETASSLSRFSV